MLTRTHRRPNVSGLLLTAALTVGLVAVGGSATAAAPSPVPAVAFATAPEAPSRYQPQVSCDPTEKPGTAALRDLLRRSYGTANSGGIARACGQGGTSEHKEGRAYDWMLNAANPADKAIADSFLAWLVGPDAQGVAAGNAHRLGVQYVIWNRQTWQSWTGSWKPYTGSSPHTDHVHTSLSWDGALKRTSWWTGAAVSRTDYGPCRVYTGEPAPAYGGANYSPCPLTGPRPAETGPTALAAGQQLTAGQQLVSADGRYRAVMQSDGNFVVYAGSRVLWHAGTHGRPGSWLAVQTDGNLVIYSPGRAPWHTGTYVNAGTRLTMQTDGNLVVYRPDNRPLWNTGGDRG